MKIVFVYNADSGIINAILDASHKVLSPSTYSCSLCMITYGTVSEKKEWKAYRKTSAHEFEFLHRDEFEDTYGTRKEYPVIFYADQSNEVIELIGAEELNSLRTVAELIETLEKKLSALAKSS